MVKVRNTEEYAKGVKKLGRSKALSKTGRYRFIKKGADGKKTEKKPSTVRISKNRLADAYPGKKQTHGKKTKVSVPKLRSSITPGTVLIILAGRFAGVRVVFLKQLISGLLLVTGPFKLNGCPIRRINQAYVIATATKIDISKVNVPAHIDDKYFARAKVESSATTKEEKFLEKQNQTGPVINEAYMAKRKEDQKAVDTAILAVMGDDKLLASYLSSKFSLSKHQHPHKMNF